MLRTADKTLFIRAVCLAMVPRQISPRPMIGPRRRPNGRWPPGHSVKHVLLGPGFDEKAEYLRRHDPAGRQPAFHLEQLIQQAIVLSLVCRTVVVPLGEHESFFPVEVLLCNRDQGRRGQRHLLWGAVRGDDGMQCAGVRRLRGLDSVSGRHHFTVTGTDAMTFSNSNASLPELASVLESVIL